MTSTSLRPEEVAKYLKDHPEFFDEYADLLSTVSVQHPYGRHAIPLSERQVLALRERGRALEGKLRELVQFGEENDAIGDQVHRLSLALLAARGLPALLQAIECNLREDFRIPALALRLWSEEGEKGGPEREPVSEETRLFADSLTIPYFSDRAMFDSAQWFGDAAGALHSFVYVSLRGEAPLGVLALASPDPGRFTPDMGTLYLERLGELIDTALRRHLSA